MQFPPLAACALLLIGMVAAQPPLPPPGVNSKCSAALTRMANASTAPAPRLPCSPGHPGRTVCSTSIFCKSKNCQECSNPPHPYPCAPYGMLPFWKFWVSRINFAGHCIPNNSSNSPKPGVVCNTSDVDLNMDTGDYKGACYKNHGNPVIKYINLVWGPEYTCKDGAGKATPCLMHTETIACMPTDCTASDILLVDAKETKALCATLAPYNLSSCAVKLTTRTPF